ncbi:MAG: hypothetical protein ACRYGG_22855, partial [Janthinobacterium lividum]
MLDKNTENDFQAVPQPTNFFESWEIDEQFLNRVLSRVADIDVVALDIFDTALTRSVDSPADAFAEVERRLIREYGGPAIGFAAERENAERLARIHQLETCGAEEIRYQHIYAQLHVKNAQLADMWTRAAELELEVESSLVIAVPDILELTKRLLHLHKPFIFVSDMYLPAEFLARLLSRAGYSGWTHLYVSSETLATKASGRQWKIVESRYADLHRILHIGDDELRDHLVPSKYQIRTEPFKRARSEQRVGAALDVHVLPFSYAQRDVVLRSRATAERPIDESERWRNMGRTLGGIVLAGFMRWLEQRVLRHQIGKLYFCARDGWLLRRAW